MPFPGWAIVGLTQVKVGSASKQRWCSGAAACSAAMRACVAHVRYMGSYKISTITKCCQRSSAAPAPN